MRDLHSDAIPRSPSPEFSPLAMGASLTALPQYKAPRTTSVDFSGLLSEPLELQEDLTTGCGGQLWPAGMVLAKHFLRLQPHDVRDARILELGAGGGLVGLAVAKGCRPKSVLYITDQVEMEALMHRNILANKLEQGVRAAILNWGEPLSREIIDFKPTIILAADCVYFEPAFPLLLRTLADLLTLSPNATVYFCFQKRRRADLQFMKSARKAFVVTEITEEDKPAAERSKLFLYTFTRR